MDRNTIIGFILIAAVLFGYAYWSTPSAEEQQAQIEQMKKDSADAVKKVEGDKIAKQKQAEAIKAATADTTALFHAALTGKAENIVLKNEKVELTFSTKGATVTKAFIKKDANGKNYVGHDIADKSGKHDNPNGVTLFEGDEQSLAFKLDTKEANINTQDLYFTPSAQTDSSVTFTAEAAQGKSIVLTYTLGHDYLLHLSMQVNGMEGLFASNTKTMAVDWKEKARQQERGHSFENRYATLTYKEKDGSTDNLSETSDDDEKTEEALDWVAFRNQFFSAVIIPKTDFAANASLASKPLDKESRYLKDYSAQLNTFFDPSGKQPTEFEFYYGPNDYSILSDIEDESAFGKELDLQKLVSLGWPLFRWINQFFTRPVFDWLTGWGIPMGIVLILITMLLKAITYPMVKKSYMSSAKMRVLKPKLEEATKQYDKPEDAMQKQQAMMQMYSEYGVSPLSGCLPMLIQMPIWIAMFNFVPNAIQLRGEGFLWINDLSTYDPIVEWSNNLWLIGDHLSLTCILFCVANLLYSWLTMRQQRDQMVGQQADQMKMMQWMMFLMPLMFFFIFNDYSAGLNFYYFISLFFSAAIMWTLRKTTDDAKLLAILEARRAENKKNPQKKQSGLAARLQKMQQEQMELQRKRQELERQRRK